jgi:hypothetical protein
MWDEIVIEAGRSERHFQPLALSRAIQSARVARPVRPLHGFTGVVLLAFVSSVVLALWISALNVKCRDVTIPQNGEKLRGPDLTRHR